MGCNHNYIFTKGHFECTKCGHNKHHKSQSSSNKKISVGIAIISIAGIIGFLFVNEIVEINQKNLDESFQNMPENIIEAGESAKDFAIRTDTTLREVLSNQLDKVQLEPVENTVDEIAKIPRQIQENNPLNEKPVIDKKELEIQVHQLTNQYRTLNGLEPLSLDGKLSSVSRGHSQDMAIRNYFAHETPEGIDPTGRATTLGYNCQKVIGNLIYTGIGENIFQNNLYDTIWYVGVIPTSYDWNTQDEIAQTTVDGWMDSPGHRENILTSTFDREGVGVEIAEDDKVYITQNFC